MPYWSPATALSKPPPPRDFGVEARVRAQQRLAVLLTQLRNAHPPNVLFEPEAQELRNLCRILGLPLTVDRIDLTTGAVERITIDPQPAAVTG
jgi:hypothetical protein